MEGQLKLFVEMKSGGWWSGEKYWSTQEGSFRGKHEEWGKKYGEGDAVPAGLVAKIVKDSGLTYNEIARRMGCDARLVSCWATGRDGATYRKYETAVRACRAVGADPVDYGL